MGTADTHTKRIAPFTDHGPRFRHAAEQLARRLWYASWWRSILRQHPGGLVCVTTAARILGVGTKRINTLIDEGHLPVIRLPDGTRNDVYVPFDALISMPSRLHQGNKRRQGRENGRPDPENPYVSYLHNPYKEDFSRFPENDRKSLPVRKLH